MSDEATPQGYRIDMSAVYGTIFMFGACLLIAFLARGRWWGYIGQGLYIALLGVVYTTAFSRSAYETERKNKCPELKRGDYVQVTILFFALVPTLAWLGLMLPMLAHNLRGTR